MLHLNPGFTAPSLQIVVHLPWFVELQSATVGGAPAQSAGGTLAVSVAAKEIRLRWTLQPNIPVMSYDRAVREYKAEYARRYRVLMHGEASHKE
ncbi:MAG: hypothetical protein ABSC47_04260 [Terracidiphilus sp.]